MRIFVVLIVVLIVAGLLLVPAPAQAQEQAQGDYKVFIPAISTRHLPSDPDRVRQIVEQTGLGTFESSPVYLPPEVAAAAGIPADTVQGTLDTFTISVDDAEKLPLEIQRELGIDDLREQIERVRKIIAP